MVHSVTRPRASWPQRSLSFLVSGDPDSVGGAGQVCRRLPLGWDSPQVILGFSVRARGFGRGTQQESAVLVPSQRVHVTRSELSRQALALAPGSGTARQPSQPLLREVTLSPFLCCPPGAGRRLCGPCRPKSSALLVPFCPRNFLWHFLPSPGNKFTTDLSENCLYFSIF